MFSRILTHYENLLDLWWSSIIDATDFHISRFYESTYPFWLHKSKKIYVVYREIFELHKSIHKQPPLRPVTLLKILRMLQNFREHLLYRIFLDDCFSPEHMTSRNAGSVNDYMKWLLKIIIVFGYCKTLLYLVIVKHARKSFIWFDHESEEKKSTRKTRVWGILKPV